MKTKNISFLLLGIFLLFFIGACNLLNLDSLGTKTLSTADAKVEIRSANQEIIDMKDEMLTCDGFNSLNYLLELMSGSSFKSKRITPDVFNSHYSLTKALNYFRESKNLKSAKTDDVVYYGIFEYNFYTEEFDQVGQSTTVYQMSFPADESAKIAMKLNAVLTIDNLKYAEVASTEEYYNPDTYEYETRATTEKVPVQADINLKVDKVSTTTGNYKAKYSDDGMPTSMTVSLNSCDYSLDLSFSGSSVNYKTTLDYKLGKDLIMGYDLEVKYTSDMDDAETISGSYTVAPLKFEGTVNVDAINTETTNADENGTKPDIAYINKQIDVDVIQIDKKAKIGHLEYDLYTDPDTDNESLQMFIVYEDGTSELLSDVITIME